MWKHCEVQAGTTDKGMYSYAEVFSMPHRIPNIVLMLLRLLVMGLLLCSRVQGRVMTNLERQKEAAKNFENSKQKNMDLRANAREARQTLDQELARAKQLHKDRRKGLDLKREEAAKEWALKRQKEEEEAKKAAAAAKEDNSGYEYVYVDEDGNYYEVEDAEDSTEEEEDVEEVEEEVLPPSRNNRVTSSIVLDKGNISHLNRLRDDHQLNLKEQRESLKKRRQEKRDAKAQELMDEFIELEGARVTMSRMTSAELMEQKEYQKNLTKALSRAEKVMMERAEEANEFNTLTTGSRVMARYDKKSQFLLGRITNARPDGTFDIRYDMGAEESRVDRTLVVPVASDEAEGGQKKGGKDKDNFGQDDLKDRGITSKEQQKQHFLELYAKREEARQEQLAAMEEPEPEKVDGRVMGADCESQACGACKLIVDEFAQRVHANINNKEVQNLDALFDYITPFCDSPQITNKYTKVVQMACHHMFSKDRAREFFIREFEADSDWANVLSTTTLLPKKQKICQTTGFCAEDSFEYERDEDDGWGSDECFVCHALMEDLEEKATLYKSITDSSSPDIAKGACDNLVLEEDYASACAKMITGISLIEVAWTLKLHFEQIQKKKVTFRGFSDTSCEKLSLCQRWVDPDLAELTSVLDEIEHVYS